MTGYEWALFVHIVATCVMFAGIGITDLALRAIRGAETGAVLRLWSRVAARFDPVIPVAGLVLVGSGAYMTDDAWSFDATWIQASLAIVGVMFVAGPTVVTRRLLAIEKAAAIAADGPLDPALRRHTQDPILFTASFTLTLLTLALVYIMVDRPEVAGVLGATLTATAVGLASGWPAWRRGRRWAGAATEPSA